MDKDKFTKEIFSILAEQEPIRKMVLQKTFWGVVLFLLVIFACIYIAIAYLYSKTYFTWSFYILCFTVFCLIPFVYYRNQSFKIFLKDKCYEQIKDAFNVVYKEDTSEIEDILSGNNLFSSFNEIEVDDNMSGYYNGVEFKIAEVELTDVQCCPRATERHNIFCGVVICFKSNKKAKSEVLIVPKRDFNILDFRMANWLNVFVFGIAFVFLFAVCIKNFIMQSYAVGWFILLLASIPLGYIIAVCISFYKNQKKVSAIKIEDVLFSKSHKIYSDNQIEARYLVTTSFMERFKNLKTAFGSDNIKCSFYGENVIFAIPSKKDLFELGDLYTPLNENNKYVKKFYEELQSIHDMIDYFRFNQHTGL